MKSLRSLFLLVVLNLIFQLNSAARFEDLEIIRQVTSSAPNFTCSVSSFTISERIAPKPLLVFTPREPGNYPVIFFQHGFMLTNSIYSQMLTQLSTSCFIIVAPQLPSSLLNPDATQNIQEAARVIEWLPNMAASFPSNLSRVSFDLGKLVVMGHSKGGKIAFALALKISSNVSLPFSALVALDPVDGDENAQTKPKVLPTNNDFGEFNLPYPTLIIGTGLGPEKAFPLFPACAPRKFGYASFFKASSAPAFQFVPVNYGHMDFVDDKLDLAQNAIVTACKQTPRGIRGPMRSFTSNLVAAFVRGVVWDDNEQFQKQLDNPASSPIQIETPLSKGRV